MRLSRSVTRTLAVAVTVVALTIAVAAIPTSSPQDRATTWAKSLSAAERQAYSRGEQLEGLPTEYRRAVSMTLSSANERVAFWQAIITEYRQTQQLTADQGAVLARVEAMLTPALFSGRRPSQSQSLALTDVRSAVTRILGQGAERRLFFAHGSSVHSITSSLSLAERLGYAWRTSRSSGVLALVTRIVPVVDANAWTCNCAESNDCSTRTHCTESTGCTATTWGCAAWWLGPCSALCTYDET